MRTEFALLLIGFVKRIGLGVRLAEVIPHVGEQLRVFEVGGTAHAEEDFADARASAFIGLFGEVDEEDGRYRPIGEVGVFDVGVVGFANGGVALIRSVFKATRGRGPKVSGFEVGEVTVDGLLVLVKIIGLVV